MGGGGGPIPTMAGGIRGLLGQRFSDIAELWLGAETDGGGDGPSVVGDYGAATVWENSGLQFQEGVRENGVKE